MKLVDVHIHLDFDQYKDINSILKEAKEKHVKAIIANGVNQKSNEKVLELAKIDPIIKPALGLYPTDIQDLSEEKIEDSLEFIKKNPKVAFGEVGLDLKDSTPKQFEVQKKVFSRFIELSEKTKKPLIIHSRKAELQVIEMLESSTLKNPVMHCFMGKKKLMQRASDNEYNFSILPIAQKSQQIQDTIKYVPLKQLLTETDGPFMSPDEEFNKPHKVIHAIKTIAEIKNLEVEETANIIFMNYLKKFKS